MAYTFPQQRLSKKNKIKNNYSWAKSVIDEIERQSSDNRIDSNSNTLDKKKVNYDLFNGKLDREDFEYVCKPYGMDVGEMPAELRHYDITSPKLRVLFGEEIKRPFNYKVVSTNPESITDKERMKADLVRQYVTEQIQMKVQQTLQMQMQQALEELAAEADIYKDTLVKETLVVLVHQKEIQAVEQDLLEEHHHGHNSIVVEAEEHRNKDKLVLANLVMEETELQIQLQDRLLHEAAAVAAELISDMEVVHPEDRVVVDQAQLETLVVILHLKEISEAQVITVPVAVLYLLIMTISA